MGGQVISIDFGDVEYPVATSAVTAGWAATETGNVAGPTAFATTDRAMVPTPNLGIQMKLTRRALKKSGAVLEEAITRTMASTIADGRVQYDSNGHGQSQQL